MRQQLELLRNILGLTEIMKESDEQWIAIRNYQYLIHMQNVVDIG